MALVVQVLAWDGHKNVAGLNKLTRGFVKKKISETNRLNDLLHSTNDVQCMYSPVQRFRS